jgi:hypothetical protein
VPCAHVLSCSSLKSIFFYNLAQLGAFFVQDVLLFWYSLALWCCQYLVIAKETSGIGLKFPS